MPVKRNFPGNFFVLLKKLTGKAAPVLLAVILLSSTCWAQEILYNNSYSIACHNCYEKKYSQSLSDALSYTSTLEIDIWDMPLLLNKLGSMDNDWFVKHTYFQKGNNNCFGGSLANCLTEIANWSASNPDHDVITVFLDKKQGWSNRSGTRKPADLDKLITSIFDKEKIFTPANLTRNDANLRTAVKNHNWIPLNDLKGKVVFIITDATLFRPRNAILNKYLNKRKSAATCFVAPTIKKELEIAKPKGISKSNMTDIIIYNLNFKHIALSETISANNYVNRVFRSPENPNKLHNLPYKKVNFVALYNYKLNSRPGT